VDQVTAYAARLGIPVRDPVLLQQALTHASWVHEHPGESPGHNERLEFFGDAVVNLAISEALLRRHPTDDEGVLSARRAAIVSTHGLARIGARLDLGEHLRLGEGEARRGGRRRPSILASAFEAVAGAICLDLGWPAARDWVIAIATPEIEAETAPLALKSPKSRLQEHTQRLGSRPEYRVLEATGPDHEKEFRVVVAVDGEALGTGTGPSRRQAETVAAAAALDVLIARQEAPRHDEGSA
jgi:ribonuclease-3